MATGFECNWLPTDDEPMGIHDIRSLLSGVDLLDDPDRLNLAVDKLRQEGLNETLIIDNLVGAYCPIVAMNSALSDAQKATQVRRFASKIIPIVYMIEDTENVILDVPFSPTVVDAIKAKAKEAGVAPEKWISDIVSNALKNEKQIP